MIAKDTIVHTVHDRDLGHRQNHMSPVMQWIGISDTGIRSREPTPYKHRSMWPVERQDVVDMHGSRHNDCDRHGFGRHGLMYVSKHVVGGMQSVLE